MYRLILLAVCLAWLAGCNASPSGPAADMRGRYEGPIADTGGPVVVRPAGVRAGDGGVFLDIAVEGPREDAMWVAETLGRGTYFFRWPEVDKIIMSDHKGPVRLRAPREETQPLFAMVQYREATAVFKEDDGRARLMIEVPVRCRIPQSPVRVELSESGIHEALKKDAGRNAFVPNLERRLETVRARGVATRIETAELDVIPPPPRVHQ